MGGACKITSLYLSLAFLLARLLYNQSILILAFWATLIIDDIIILFILFIILILFTMRYNVVQSKNAAFLKYILKHKQTLVHQIQ